MHKPKRQRTHAPGHTKARHATPFRSPSRSPPPVPASQKSSSSSTRAPRPTSFTPAAALRDSSVPKTLFSNTTLSLPSQRYTRSRTNRAHYYLFEQKPSSSSSSTKSPSSSNKRLPPQRPTAPMLNYVQLITTPTADTPGTCLLVHHDNRRYLFGNIAEGTQRAFVQQKVSLSRAEEIFLTGTIDWRTAGGLLGMILTVAEVVQAARAAAIDESAAKAAKLKKSESKAASHASAVAAAEAAAAAAANAPPRTLSIHGGANLTQLLATARRFIFRKGLPLRPHEVREDIVSNQKDSSDSAIFREPDWSDENIMVWYVPVFAEGGSSSNSKNGSTSVPSRKRGQDENANDSSSKTEGEIEAEDRALVSSVVNHMFDSDWQLDALVETTLHAAKLPAKLFVKDEQGHLKVYDGPMPGQEKDGIEVPDIPVLVRQPWPAALIQSLPPTQPARQTMCYIVRNHPRRGKFNAAEAARLGVAKHDNRRLVAGETVTAANGSTVTPEMVIGASVDGTAFAVVELPDASYIDAFLAKPEWTNADMMGAVDTIFWLLGPGVVADSQLQAFMQKHNKIRHTISSTDTCANRLALSSAAALQVKHNRVDPERFPIHQYDNVAPTPASPVPIKESEDKDSERPLYEAARPGWTVRLAPQVIEEEKKVYPYVNFTDAIKEMDPQVLVLADAAREQVAKPSFQSAVTASNAGLPHPNTEVIPLGTGSAMPSKYRNVSATLVRVPGVGSYLFDCGENTLGSMRRMLGDKVLDEVLKELRVLWISHLHADHHLGTVSVIRAWRDATESLANSKDNKTQKSRLMVASHINMLHWLREYAEIQDFGLDRVFQVDIDCPDFPRSRMCAPFVPSADVAAEFGLERIDACRVEHCHGALAVVFTWKSASEGQDPLKIAYSGDCRPSADFATIGRGATLLLHESTFDDELKGEALAKKHSTMGEALGVGRDMGARRVLLTHFSQRYPKIPVFNASDNNNVAAEMQVLVAFDQMCVRLGDFKTAAAFLPALQKLYEGEERQS
ncbi:hypothetical protein SBRCBS47491_002522 [Sporothrix bragantina]|uniref:ribonuclease Z n=1 Tax=Sporothrix bragantina TaxID=671064 RepID=A0ABP0B7M9_9PEZI